MIVIDPRAGSKNLIGLFPKNITAVFEIPACDILLTDADGSNMWTGIEFKKVEELLGCMVTGRFAGTQLPKMIDLVDDYWLLIEGPFKKGVHGELMLPSRHKHGEWYHAKVGGRHFDMDDLEKWIITMVTCTNLKIKTTQGRMETRDWVMLLYSWWERGKDKHRSHLVTDKSRVQAELVRAGLLRRWAEQLPGIGHDKAFRVEAHFCDPFEMAVADVAEWEKIEGIGQKMAERIVSAIRGNGNS